ncbi:hypothetical protein EZV62_018480 [Acer yangbiense]|uniref:Serine-threonine/tyrosine-protein kinase catalytic domain-containing protein n=1 Tax=Acer yangbiense TaxID=1000413 RepID=A0A5C7HJH7_9ROSI|nr:hypothetical protein EZV62_018480 [Acer yangbiense]
MSKPKNFFRNLLRPFSFSSSKDGQNEEDLEKIAAQEQKSFPFEAYKLYKKGRSLEIVDPKLADSGATDQIAMCIQIGLLCTQGDPKLRPLMRRVAVLLTKKPGHLEEPSRPGVPGSRYRRARRPAAMSSSTLGTGGSSGESNSRTYDTSLNSNTASASTSALSSPRQDRHGKRPMQS